MCRYFYIGVLVWLGNEIVANEMNNQIPKIKCWVVWRSMRKLISKRLDAWTREIYEKVKVWETDQYNHKKLERGGSLDMENDTPK